MNWMSGVMIKEIALVLSAILELICFIFGSYNAMVFTWIMLINGIFMTGLGLHIIALEEEKK